MAGVKGSTSAAEAVLLGVVFIAAIVVLMAAMGPQIANTLGR